MSELAKRETIRCPVCQEVSDTEGICSKCAPVDEEWVAREKRIAELERDLAAWHDWYRTNGSVTGADEIYDRQVRHRTAAATSGAATDSISSQTQIGKG
jgi:hypothetical protein